MSNVKTTRQKLVSDINDTNRKLSTLTVIFHQSMAEKAGLSGADHKYLDLLFQEGSMTAGRLAQLTGLTTGAVTGIIDRLEKLALVKREKDPDDRRRVVVVLQMDNAMKRLAPLFDALRADLEAYYENFTDQELETIRKYLMGTVNFFSKKTNPLK